MSQNVLGLVTALIAVILLPGCGHDQQLVSIVIQPSTQNFGSANTPVSEDAGLNVHLRALGSYIHPPVTKDITNQVIWSSSSPNIVTVDASGILTPTGMACGSSLVSATVNTNKSSGNISSSGAIVTGTMTANVICFVANGPTLTVDFMGVGSGTVMSTPAALQCTTTCSSRFASGTTVTLTATPISGSMFGSWAGCDSMSGMSCTVTNLTANRTVTVTFD